MFQEGNLKRYPTPYPDELKSMVKTAQSVAHRLKEDESSDESGRDARPSERKHVGVQDVGVKVTTPPPTHPPHPLFTTTPPPHHNDTPPTTQQNTNTKTNDARGRERGRVRWSQTT